MTTYIPNSEELGRRRFPDNKSFRKALQLSADNYLSQMQGLLPSNYPKDPSTNLAIFNRVIAREFARLKSSNDAISNDKEYTQTRIQYLQQILGERLFLSDKIAPANYNDETYRNYLISIKNAYLHGSKKINIEALASEFTGQRINLKELYLEARTPGSSLDVSDTNKMVVQVFIDDYLRAGYNINNLKSDLDFFINLVRPAHVLYDTELIWTDTIDTNKTYNVLFGDTGGGCVPVYVYDTLAEPTIMAMQVFVLPDNVGATGQIDSIHNTDLMFFLYDSTKVITEPGLNGTKFFSVAGKQISFDDLEIGQYVKIIYQVIPGSFEFYWFPSLIVTSWNSQFYKSVYQRPLFQETVKKVMDAQGRFPLQIKTTPTTICDRWVQDTLQPLYEDMRRPCNTGSSHHRLYSRLFSKKLSNPHFSWPYANSQDSTVSGNDYIYQMLHYPLSDGSSNPAGILDVSLAVDSTVLPEPFSSVDASSGKVFLKNYSSYWDQTAGLYLTPGNDMVFSYHYFDGTSNIDSTNSICFGVSFWQLPKVPAVQSTGTLAGIGNIGLSVDGTSISNALTDLNPILGHVTLQSSSDFWKSSELNRLPKIGDTFEFDYYYGLKYSYSLLFDDPSRVMDSAPEAGNIGFVFDSDSTDLNQPISPEAPLEIGYRYRGYLLHHTGVLNSPDTLKLNSFQKPANRASIVNQQETINHYNTFFSPEFLYDTNPQIVLDDPYLKNGLDPVLKLQEGTPPFQKTFSYQPGLIYQKKLQDIRTNHELLLYSDLLLEETQTGNKEMTLSPICDIEPVEFKVGFKEEIPLIAECSPWELFDTVQYIDRDITITGDYTSVTGLTISQEFRGIHNLRIIDKHLRDNFILREIGPTGTALVIYTFTTPVDQEPQTEFYLPSTFKYLFDEAYIDFPSLPIVRNITDMASISDVSVKINGVPWPLVALDPLTGWFKILDYPEEISIEQEYTLTAQNIESHRLVLPGYPLDPGNTSLTVIYGTSQFFQDDFVLYGRYLSWLGGPLEHLFEVGDKIRVSYIVNPLINAEIEVTYRIRNTANIRVLDRDWSRVFDDRFVFTGRCYDEYKTDMGVNFEEYLPALDDYSDNIKYVYFNKDTLAVEEHVFTGPVFDYHCITEDEIGSPDNFPNALVKLKSPTHSTNPLNYITDYGFLNDSVVRIRKKTFKELLPDRTFRTTRLLEMLPV